jgi:hypothetical protein
MSIDKESESLSGRVSSVDVATQTAYQTAILQTLLETNAEIIAILKNREIDAVTRQIRERVSFHAMENFKDGEHKGNT